MQVRPNWSCYQLFKESILLTLLTHYVILSPIVMGWYFRYKTYNIIAVFVVVDNIKLLNEINEKYYSLWNNYFKAIKLLNAT